MSDRCNDMPEKQAEDLANVGEQEISPPPGSIPAAADYIDETKLRRRNIYNCPSCGAFLPKLDEPICPFCMAGVADLPVFSKHISGEVTEESVEAEIASLGEPDPIKTPASSPTERYYQCPICYTYMDALISVSGEPARLYHQELLGCPECGCQSEFDSVEQENGHPFFRFKYPLRKADYVGNIDRKVLTTIRTADGLIEQGGIFRGDPQFDKDEPRWPRSLAAVVMGSIVYLGEKLDKFSAAIMKMSKNQGNRRKRNRSKHPNGNRRDRQSKGYYKRP